jgi:glycosyltransferase involved in cell wall biosynthesis
LQSRIERWIVHSADQLVFLSPSTARVYRRRYPHAAAMAVITNGHDATEVIERKATNNAAGRYRIVWTGELYRPAELAMFLEAIKLLIDRRPALGDTLAVDFFGHVTDECNAIADRFSRDGSLAGVIRFHGFVPRRAALQEVADADAALVMLGSGAGVGQFVPGKLFDYLGQNKQVLAVLPPGDARDILEELNWGVIADPDVEQIGRAIERLIELPTAQRLADPEGRFNRAILAGRLADTLRAATGDVGNSAGAPSAI